MKQFTHSLTISTVLCLLAACSGTPTAEAPPDDNENPSPAEETYQNPVLNQDFPDPTVIAAPDGWYYAYGTETMINAQPYNIQVARSQDLVNWSWEGDALPEGVAWASQGRMLLGSARALRARARPVRHVLLRTSRRARRQMPCRGHL